MSRPLTPMMKQWLDLKSEAGDALLFFRLGDFYELFESDAITAAPILGVVLTSRNSKGDEPAPALCGIPVHQLEAYLPKVLDRGFAIAIAEQTEDPAAAKGLVRREITQWFSPGMRYGLQDERPHYIGFLIGDKKSWTLVAADVATGHTVIETGSELDALNDLLQRLPVEDLRGPKLVHFEIPHPFQRASFTLQEPEAIKEVCDGFLLSHTEDLTIKDKDQLVALGSLFQLIKRLHPTIRCRFQIPHPEKKHVWLSATTRKHLHLTEPEGRSIFDLLNKTETAMGRRRLRFLLHEPTQDLEEIKSRQLLLKWFKEKTFERRQFRQGLQSLLDMQRLLRRRQEPKILFQIKESLSRGVSILKNMTGPSHPRWNAWEKCCQKLLPLYEELHQRLQWSEDPELGWIQKGQSPELDQLRELKSNSDAALSSLEVEIRDRWKISGLRIKFHQTFGYVIEMSRQHRDKVPSGTKLIQSLANAERYKIDELNILEEKILSVDKRILEAEKAELEKMKELIKSHESLLMEWAETLSFLDAFQSLAEVSSQLGWTTPITVDGEQKLTLEEAWHPLSGAHFVPLSFSLEKNNERLLLLTGPNMSGKSTLLRLAALTALLHQMGSDIPAKNGALSLFDRILCRMGAGDDLLQGQSTFFVEMREVASMLLTATPQSLLLLDEVGRGTSTYDGMSLAWAITESVHERQSLAMVATHYLELADLEKTLPHLSNKHLGVKEVGGKLIFTRKLEQGAASRSYGIHVAKLAEIPPKVLERAQQKLNQLEGRRSKPTPLFEWQASEGRSPEAS